MSTIVADPCKGLMPNWKRLTWLLLYLFKRNEGQSTGITVDVLDRAFVDGYTDATNTPFSVMNYGANKCITLGRDLSELHDLGYMQRFRTGISGMGPGFPRWVYSYSLTEAGTRRAQLLNGRTTVKVDTTP